MKNLIAIMAIVFVSSCNKHLHEGKQVVRAVQGNYVKFEDLRRWYYIPKKVKVGDELYMMIQNRQLSFL